MYTGESALPIAFMHQHIVTVTPSSAEEIRATCYTPFSAESLFGLTTVDIPVSAKFQLLCGASVPSRRKTSFKLPKKALTTGRLIKSIDLNSFTLDYEEIDFLICEIH